MAGEETGQQQGSTEASDSDAANCVVEVLTLSAQGLQWQLWLSHRGQEQGGEAVM